VRITGQLIDTGLDVHIWADAFDRELTDLFELQDEISERVVSAIEPAMRHSEGIRIVKKNKISMSAFDCFQHGMWHFNKMSKEDNASAIALFRKSIVLDPEMSHGHTGLARALYNAALQGWSDDPALDFAEAGRIARQAIALDPRDAYGHFALSGALLYLAQHDEALAEARQAVALNPNFAFGHFRLGQVLTYLGRAADAVAPIERSIRLSPHDPQLGAMRAQLALTLYHAEKYDISAEQAQEAVRLQYIPALGVLAPSLARLGRADEALSALATYAPHLEKQMQTRTLSLPPYAHARDRLHLLEGLRLAGLPNSIISAVR
jgi:tetratricopeptide (TPR) repeat protein